MNKTKTTVMRKTKKKIEFRVDEKQVEVESFKYLGSYDRITSTLKMCYSLNKAYE